MDDTARTETQVRMLSYSLQQSALLETISKSWHTHPQGWELGQFSAYPLLPDHCSSAISLNKTILFPAVLMNPQEFWLVDPELCFFKAAGCVLS